MLFILSFQCRLRNPIIFIREDEQLSQISCEQMKLSIGKKIEHLPLLTSDVLYNAICVLGAQGLSHYSLLSVS